LIHSLAAAVWLAFHPIRLGSALVGMLETVFIVTVFIFIGVWQPSELFSIPGLTLWARLATACALATGLFLLAAWRLQWRLDKMSVEPGPNIVFERDSPAENTVVTYTFPSYRAKIEEGEGLPSHFARAQFCNAGSELRKVTRLDRPFVTFEVIDTSGKCVASVGHARMTHGKTRLEPFFQGKPPLSEDEILVDEIRVGKSFVVDILCRPKSAAMACTWSNSDSMMGQEDIAPGTYSVVLRFNGEGVRTHVERLLVVIPDTIGSAMVVSRPPSRERHWRRK